MSNYDLEKLTHSLKIQNKVFETPEAVTLTFEIPDDLKGKFRFSAGQFLTLFLNIHGEIVPRSYSLCSSPATDKQLMVTVKKVTGGKGSNFIIDHLNIGDTVRVAPPAGTFYRPPVSNGPSHFLLAAAGSGITPVYSILKTVLMTEPGSTATLVYANKKPELVIYKKSLEDLERQFSGRLKVVHVYSQCNTAAGAEYGRCEGPLLRRILEAHLPANKEHVEAYLCGPAAFMDNFKSALSDLRVSMAQIHQESFAPAPASSSPAESGGDDSSLVYIGDATAPRATGAAQVTVYLQGEQIELTAPTNQSIVETLIGAGYNPPYSCLEGNCMACVAKVKKGRVSQRDPGILLDENMAAGETLTCQALPVSQTIVIDYDSL